MAVMSLGKRKILARLSSYIPLSWRESLANQSIAIVHGIWSVLCDWTQCVIISGVFMEMWHAFISIIKSKIAFKEGDLKIVTYTAFKYCLIDGFAEITEGSESGRNVFRVKDSQRYAMLQNMTYDAQSGNEMETEDENNKLTHETRILCRNAFVRKFPNASF